MLNGSLQKLNDRAVAKKVFWAALAFGGCYGAYRVYNSVSVAEQRSRLIKFYNSFVSAVDAFSSVSSVVRLAAKDLERFISSEADELPQSIQQLMKIFHCIEFQSAIAYTSRSVTEGVISASQVSYSNPSTSSQSRGPSSLEIVLDRLLSDRGKNFASALVGKAVRNFTYAFFEQQQKAVSRVKGRSNDETQQAQKWLDVVVTVSSTPRGRELISFIISTFTACAVSTFLDKTENVNMYDDIVSSITKAESRQPMTELLKSICGEAVESLVRTSHDVLTSSQKPREPQSPTTPKEAPPGTSSLEPRTYFVDAPSCQRTPMNLQVVPLIEKGRVSSKKTWPVEVIKLLAVPESRKILTDVAGTITDKGIRTSVAVAFETAANIFNLSTPVNLPSTSSSFRKAAGSALTAASVCLALILHLLTGRETVQQGFS